MERDFDVVELMRSIRAKLRDEYEKNPELRKERLQKIRKKYSKKKRRQKNSASINKLYT